MRPNHHQVSKTAEKTRIEQAERRTEEAETRTGQARTRAELAETRTEQAEARIESAKTRTENAESRTERAEARTELAEMALARALREHVETPLETSSQTRETVALNGITGANVLAELTERQREVLQFIAQGQTTKEIADALKISPKTVEYHRVKLMECLNLHDIPSLVRCALRAGLIPPEH